MSPPATPPYQPVLSELWTPLVAITASFAGRDSGQIAVSAHGASIVPDRPRVLVQLYKRNLTHDLVMGSGTFALHLLRADQLELAHALGFVSGRSRDKLSSLSFQRGITGSPVLEDCAGHVECVVINGMDAGDMTCFLADVVAGAMRQGVEQPLQPLWWRDMRRRMPAAWNDEWNEKLVAELEFSAQLFDHIDHGPWRRHNSST